PPAPDQRHEQGAAEDEAGPGQGERRPVGDDLFDADEGHTPHGGHEDGGGDVAGMHSMVVLIAGSRTPTGRSVCRPVRPGYARRETITSETNRRPTMAKTESTLQG